MIEPESQPSSVFYDRLAGEYDKRMSLNSTDLLLRSAFVDLVAQHVAFGSTLLDFGCGTGLDAAEYVRRGYKVHAYDSSVGMMARLQDRCRDHIATGAIKTYSAEDSAFLDLLPLTPAPHAVVSNFAVVNLIGDTRPLFEAFARHLAPPGWVILSILNPTHWSRLTTPQWWRCVLHRSDEAPVHGSRPYVNYLHFVPALLRAAPQFHFVGRANAGTSVRFDSAGEGTSRFWWSETERTYRRVLWNSAAYKFLGQFVFLVLRRDP
jgi:SAM-dependent methyltransferase